MGGNGGEMEKSLNEERNQCDKEGRKRDGGTKGMNGRREGGEGRVGSEASLSGHTAIATVTGR